MEQRKRPLENLVERIDLRTKYTGKRVLVTGHTGFKGSWLCEWLLRLGAEVWGVSLHPPTEPNLFEQLRLETRIERHCIRDIRSCEAIVDLMQECRPAYAFHLAAQPIVRLSYASPVDTFATNIMGTCHVLEALRIVAEPCRAVIITTDKCYENRELGQAFTESDRLGGHDPYSASKAAAELVVSSCRDSFFTENGIAVASARSGNVLGGGDYGMDRIVPDAVRALERGSPIPVRNPGSVRPWQHVLDPLHGYLMLGAKLECGSPLCSAFNFGPPPQAQRTVRELVEEILKVWPGNWVDRTDPSAPPEAGYLQLSTLKAQAELGWNSTFDFETTIRSTIEWYRNSKTDPQTRTQEQLREFEQQITTKKTGS